MEDNQTHTLPLKTAYCILICFYSSKFNEEVVFLVECDKVELVAVEGLGLAVHGGGELHAVPAMPHQSIQLIAGVVIFLVAQKTLQRCEEIKFCYEKSY